MTSRPTLLILVVLTLVAACAIQGVAQELKHYPPNPGILQDVSGPLSPTTRFWASENGKQFLLHSSNPGALGLLHWFHPEAVSQYPQEPLRKAPPAGPAHGVSKPPVTVTGCGTTTGTVMNLEPATDAVTQYGPMVDFILSELGSGLDLVAEYGFDARYDEGIFDSVDAMYVHRDPTQSCWGGTDFEMGDPPIADPFQSGLTLAGAGGGRLVADPNPAHKQFILADLRYDGYTSGVGLRRIPTTNLESTTTCPAGTLTLTQEATCAGSNGIIVFASQDNYADSVAMAQDPRTSGTGAGDIYLVSVSVRELRTVILISACKATFASMSDCSSPLILSGSLNNGLPSVAVVGGGPNAGTIAVTFGSRETDSLQSVICTPGGAPNPPNCGSAVLVYTDDNVYTEVTGNPGLELVTWPQIAARTDSDGQTLFVVWSDCAVETILPTCVQAQIVMATATALSPPVWTFHHVTGSQGQHLLPNVTYDAGQGIINLSYYTTGADLYKNRSLMAMNQISPGSTTVNSTVYVNTSPDSPQGNGDAYDDYTAGDYVGLAAHGGTSSGSSRLYIGFTSNARPGTYSGITNTQADNDILRVTY